MSFPHKNPNLPAEAQGVFRKFEVYRVDGSSAKGRKHFGCEYFVLDLSHDPHAAAAMTVYGQSCAKTHPVLSAQILERFSPQKGTK